MVHFGARVEDLKGELLELMPFGAAWVKGKMRGLKNSFDGSRVACDEPRINELELHSSARDDLSAVFQHPQILMARQYSKRPTHPLTEQIPIAL